MRLVRIIFFVLPLLLLVSLSDNLFADVHSDRVRRVESLREWLSAHAPTLESLTARPQAPLNLPLPLPFDDGTDVRVQAELSSEHTEHGRDRDPLDQGADNCPATVVNPGALPYTDTGTTVGRVNNWNTADDCGQGSTSGAPDVIYSFTPATTATYEIGLCNTVGSFDNMLEVRTGGACPGGTQIACDDDGCNGNDARLFLRLTTGITYYIIVDGAGNTAGAYTLEVNAGCDLPPLHGLVIECAETVDSSHARLDCNGGCNNDDFGGVNTFQAVPLDRTILGQGFTYVRDGLNLRDTDWYQVTLTDTGRLRVTVTSEFEMRLDLKNGTCAAGILEAAFPAPCTSTNIISDCLLPGTYYVVCSPQTFSALPLPLDYHCTIDFLPCASCADFGNYIVAPAIFTAGSGGTCDDENTCPAQPAGDHVIEINIPTDGEWSFKMCHSEVPIDPQWNSVLTLNTFCCGGTIATNDDYCGVDGFSRIDCVFLTAGTYFLVVDGATASDCGPYSVIIDRCDGSCCYQFAGEQKCEITSDQFCGVLYDGLFTPGGSCGGIGCYPLLSCDTLTDNSQQPHTPLDFWSLLTSEAGVVQHYENFGGLTEPITHVRFWGATLNSSDVECVEEPQPLSLIFYADSAGFPGARACSTAVTVAGDMTYVYGGASILVRRYDVALPTPCSLTDGWISILGRGSSACRFHWLSSPTGDGRSAQRTLPNGAFASHTADLSLCFVTNIDHERCPGRIIPSLPYTDSFNLCEAAPDFALCLPSSFDVLYQLTVPCSLSVNFSLCGSAQAWNSFLAVRSGGACVGSTPVVCQGVGCPTGQHAAATIDMLPSTPYYIVVRGQNPGDCGNYTLNVTPILGEPDSLVIRALSASTLRLDWRPVCGAAAYNVYHGDTPDFPLDAAHIRLSNFASTTVLFAAPPDLKKFYVVTAVIP